MAKVDRDLTVINSMTEEQFKNQINSDGKAPALINQIIMTDEEDVNLSQLRTKVLWTNSNPTSSFASQNIVLSSSDYDYLLLFYKTSYDSNNVVSKIFPKGYGTEIDISEVFNGDYVSVNRCRVITRNSDISLTIGNCQTGVLRNGGGTERYLTDNAMLVPIQIIGLYKQPAMIYTGAELHEGEGISINNGTISAGQNYSEEEQFTGNYWIDGRPIYRKCALRTFSSNADTWNAIFWISTSSRVILLRLDVNKYYASYEQYLSGDYYSDGNYLYEKHSSYFNGKQAYIIVEYIKQ
jgi:hypothetical protein